MAEVPVRLLEWMDTGFSLFTKQMSKLSDADLEQRSALPGWSRRVVLAHVGLNARALGRLVSWAATTLPTPMYDSPQAREREICDASSLAPSELRQLVAAEQGALSDAMANLTSEAWSRSVTTGQGRSILASEIPWLRAREVWIHAVDLEVDATFEDLPNDMLDRLIGEAVARHRANGVALPEVAVTDREGGQDRRNLGDRAVVIGPAAALANWLTRRQPDGVSSSDGSSLPELGPWL